MQNIIFLIYLYNFLFIVFSNIDYIKKHNLFIAAYRSSSRFVAAAASRTVKPLQILPQRTLVTLNTVPSPTISTASISSFGINRFLLNNNVVNLQQPVRTVIKFSLKKGKRKAVRAVREKFFRLHWGGWIRPHCGRHKKMHKKKANRKRRLRQHVLVNSTQAYLLDKMVTLFWRRPKHYIDDPYEPYHTRTFAYAQHKPRPIPRPVPTYKEELD